MDQKSFWLGVVAALAAVAVLGLLGSFSFLPGLCLAGFLPLLYAVKVFFQRGPAYAFAALVIGLIVRAIVSPYLFLLLALVVETIDAARRWTRSQRGRPPAIPSQPAGQRPEENSDSTPD